MILHGTRDIYFRMEVQILHGLFTEEATAFEKSLRLDIIDTV